MFRLRTIRILLSFGIHSQKFSFTTAAMAAKGKKGTRWKSTPGVFTQLTAHCQNDHSHLPYQVQSQNGTWTFDTSTEAAYPQLLAARVAAAVKKFLLSKNLSFSLPPIPREKTLAAQHRQHKKTEPTHPRVCRDPVALAHR